MLYFLYSFLLPLVLTVLAFAIFFPLFFFSFVPIYIWSLFFLFHPILRYTLSSFLTLLVDVGIGVGPVDGGRQTDTDTGFGRYLSLNLGRAGKGACCFFIKNFLF